MRSPLFLVVLIALCALVPTSGRQPDREEEHLQQENSLSHAPKPAEKKQLRSAGLLKSLIADPTVPVFLVMGLASLASILSAVSSHLHSNR